MGDFLTPLLSPIVKSLIEKMLSPTLPDKLNGVVEKWAKNLPEGIQFNHEALSDKLIFDPEFSDYPELAKLRDELNKNKIPSSDLWLKALVERWGEIRASQKEEDLIAFFKQDYEQAKQQLQILAENLESTCKKDRELFQVSAYDDLQEIKENTRFFRQQNASNYVKSNAPTSDFNIVLESLSIQISQLSSSLSKEKAARLEEYRELYREGQVQVAFQKVRELRQDSNWHLFEASLKSKIIRILASYTLNLLKDKEQAQKLVKEAASIDPGADDTIIRAFIGYQTTGASDALSFFEVINDVDSFNFKLALLLELGKTDDALADLNNKPIHIIENAETKRLRAMALLLTGALVEAQAEIESALYEKPNWSSVKIASAFIDYYSSLSPALLPDRLASWPSPVPFSLIKQDDESIKRLANAEKIFKELAEKQHDEKSHFENWYLAALANNQKKQNEAQLYCNSLLLKDPSNPVAVIWANARNYPIDVSSCEVFLEKITESDQNYILKKLALIDLYLSQSDITKALNLLEQTKKKFSDEGNDDTWLVWHAKVLVEDQRPEEALLDSDIAKSSEVRLTIRTTALREIARKSSDWAPFMKHLEDSYLQTGDGQLLYECCQLKARLDDFDYVVDHADDLIKVLKNHSAVDISAKAAWQKNKPGLCLKLLNDNANIYPEKKLPSELARLKIYCQNRLGLVPQALTDAEALFAEDNTTDNLLALMEMQFRKGDLKGLVSNANILRNRHDSKPINLLRVARIICTEDEELANNLWHQAVGSALTDPAEIALAIETGFKLGLDKELGPLFEQAHVFTTRGEGYFKTVDFKSLVTMIKANRDRINFVNDKYNQAEIPVHLLAEALNISLSHIYHEMPVKNMQKRDLLNQPACLVRHGGRPIQKNIVASRGNISLHLDISALLLASHLEILDQAEQLYKPLQISASLPTALYQQLEQSAPGQPGRILGYRQLIDFINDHKLKATPSYQAQKKRYLSRSMGEEWTALLEKATIEKSYIIDFFPLTSNDIHHKPVQLTKNHKPYVVSRRSLLDAMLISGVISEEKYRDILRNMDPLNQEKPAPTLPSIGSRIYLEGGTALELALAGALASVCQNFETYVSKAEIQDAKKRIEEYEHQREVVDWLEKLIYRVKNGIDSGLYEIIKLEEERSDTSDDQKSSAAFMSAIDLFKFKPQADDVIWIDDRFCNSYVHRDTVPILSILEILYSLKEKNVLIESEYYKKLLYLRAGNFRFIPIDKGEIVYHLKQAQVIENAIVETEELSVLRRYISAVLYDSARLQTPAIPPTGLQTKGEYPFILSMVHTIEDSILNIWMDESNDAKIATVYSDWILANLYTGMFGIRHLIKQDDPNNDRLDLIGLDLGSLFSRAISFGVDSIKQSGSNRRKKYFDWIEKRIVHPRFKVDPGTSVATSRTLNFMISDMANRHSKNKSEDLVSRKLLQLFYLDLPTSIREEMKLDQKLMKRIGLTNIEALKIGDSWFSVKDFWQATKHVLNGEKGVVNALQSESEFNIEISEINGIRKISIIDNAKQKQYYIDGSLVDLLSDDPEKRRTMLRNRKAWFDCDAAKCEKIIAEIISTEDIIERIRKADKLHKSSAVFFYTNLEEKLKKREDVNANDFLPESSANILRFIRLEPVESNVEDFTKRLSKSAAHLLLDEGIEKAISRLSCLPTKLPAIIIEQFQKLPIEDKNGILNEMTKCASPVCQLHLIDLALNCSEDKQYSNNLVKMTINNLLNESDGRSQFELFRAILVWLNNMTSYSAETTDWSPTYKLAALWTHASMLHNIFHSIRAIPDALAKIIESLDNKISSEIIGRDLSFWSDISHPRRINRAGLLLHGLGAVLSDKDYKSLADVIDIQIIREFAERAYTNDDYMDLPAFIDPVLAQDNICSFLGGDHSERLSYLGAETLERLPLNKRAIIKNAIQSLLKNPADEISWFHIYILLGDLPIYPELRKEFIALLKKNNIDSLTQKHPEAAILALRVTAKQIVHIQNTRIKKRLEESIIKMASYFANMTEIPESVKRPTFFKDGTIALGLIDDALSIAVKPNFPRETSRAFAALSERICKAWPLTAQKIGNANFRLSQELPARQLHGFWPLILTCRAIRTQS